MSAERFSGTARSSPSGGASPSPSSPVLALYRLRPPRLLGSFVANFGGPRGLMGRVALSMMARRNGPKNAWVVEQLGLDRESDYLDVGCGPGLALAAAAGIVTAGRVAGVDRSALSVGASRHRVPAADVGEASAAALPFDDQSFDAVSAVNTLGFWPDAEAGLREIWRVLRPGGRLALALRKYDPDAKRWDPASFGSTDDDVALVRNLVRHVGFEVLDTREGTHGETTVVVLARR